MNVTFVKGHMGPQTGWSYYRAGDRATLARGGPWLVDQGICYEGWGAKPAQVAELVVEPELKPVAGVAVEELRPPEDVDDMTVAEIRDWLNTEPYIEDVRDAFIFEQNGRARVTALASLHDYIAEFD